MNKDTECKQCGQCCSGVWLPLSPPQLQIRYSKWLSGEGERDSDIHLIYPMLKWIEEKEETICEGKPITRWLYKCVHLLEIEDEPAICTIYAHRPPMCSEYPFYGKEVIEGSIFLYDGCVFKEEPLNEK